MHVLHQIVQKAWDNTWDKVVGQAVSTIVIAVFIFVVVFLLARRFRGKEYAQDWLFDAVAGLCAVIIVGAFVFLVEMLIIVPVGMISEEQNQNSDLTDTVASLTASNSNLSTQNGGLQKKYDADESEIRTLRDFQPSDTKPYYLTPEAIQRISSKLKNASDTNEVVVVHFIQNNMMALALAKDIRSAFTNDIHLQAVGLSRIITTSLNLRDPTDPLFNVIVITNSAPEESLQEAISQMFVELNLQPDWRSDAQSPLRATTSTNMVRIVVGEEQR